MIWLWVLLGFMAVLFLTFWGGLMWSEAQNTRRWRCAWCGAWFRFGGEHVPQIGPEPTSDGICAECAQKEMADIERQEHEIIPPMPPETGGDA